MPVQNINDKPYLDRVRVYCDDNLRDELIAALDILWEHTDGRRKIEESCHFKGILDIICDDEQEGNNYGSPKDSKISLSETKSYGGHRIRLQPPHSQMGRDDNGNVYKASLLSSLAHELYHAADPNISTTAEISAFLQQAKLIEMEYSLNAELSRTRLVYDFVKEYCKSVDMKLEKGLENAFIELLIENIFSNQYMIDSLIEDDIQNNEDWRSAYRNDDRINFYVQKFETPAVNFSNMIVKYSNDKYHKNEGTEISDYSNFIPYRSEEWNNRILITNYAKQAASELLHAISEGKSIEDYVCTIKEIYASDIKVLTAGALVRIQDTPQMQPTQIGYQGKMAQRNSDIAASL
jgi:hypothetical protein